MKFKVTGMKMAVSDKAGEYKRVDIQDESGAVYAGVAYWNTMPEYADIVVGSMIEGSIVTKGKYTNLSLANAPVAGKTGPRMSPGMGKELMAEKASNISHAQDRKAQSIEQAQTRNEIMWAKYGACELIAHHPAYKNLDRAKVEAAVSQTFAYIMSLQPEHLTSAGLPVPDFHQADEDYNRSMDKDEGDLPF